MSRSAQIASWLSVVLLVTALMHTYFWWRLVSATGMPKPWRLFLTVVIIGLALFFPLPFFANRYFPNPWREIVLWVGFLWMGLSFLLFASLLTSEIPRVLLWIFGPEDPSRRLFLSRSITVGFAILALVASSYAWWNSSREPLVRKVRIGLPKLAKTMSGTTILQISDLHVGGLIRQKQIDVILRRVNEIHPDVIALTGDLVDGSSAHHAETVAAVGDLKAKYGVFFVTGNHEYYSGVEDWLDYLRKLGIRVLRNERVRIGTEQEGFDLAGIDDPNGRIVPGHGPDLPKALHGRDPNRPIVLLAHNPKAIGESSKAGIDVQLSGHTHGGQLWPFSYLTKLVHPQINGEYRIDGTELYVNPGTGFWGPPMRLGTRSEITLIELVSGH